MRIQQCFLVVMLILSVICQNIEEREENIEIFESEPVIFRASWTDPESEDFEISHQLHPLVNYTEEHTRSVEGTSCGCPNVFKPNLYTGTALPSNLIAALEFAQCLWGCVINLPVNSVQLTVNRQTLQQGQLATAGPKFTSDSVTKKLIPCPQLGAGRCPGYDMKMNVDPNSANYYYGTDGRVTSTQYDFVSVALHELGHGFGFSGFASKNGYSVSAPYVTEFDKRTRYDSGTSTYPWNVNPPVSVTACTNAVTQKKLFFQGNKYTNGKLYVNGDLSSHWDETTYPVGNVNSLLTPSLRNGESIHVVGPLTCDVMQSIGYSIPSFTNCGS